MKKSKALSAHLTELRKQAEILLDANGSKYPKFIHTHGEMQRVVHELAVHQIELVMQQNELLQTRADLEESLECYTELYDFAPLGYLTLSENGTILQANLTATKLLGIERSRLIGSKFGQYVAPDDFSVLSSLLGEVFRQPKSRTCELKLPGNGKAPEADDSSLFQEKGGVTRNPTVRIDAVASRDGDTCRAIVSDITMQKQVEFEKEALQSMPADGRQGISPERRAPDVLPDFNHHLIDKVIHARIRLAALSFLYAVTEACFVEIKKKVHTTDGNLSVHLRMLESAEYISCDKDLQARKPQTIYKITPKGHDALIQYKACIALFQGT